MAFLRKRFFALRTFEVLRAGMRFLVEAQILCSSESFAARLAGERANVLVNELVLLHIASLIEFPVAERARERRFVSVQTLVTNQIAFLSETFLANVAFERSNVRVRSLVSHFVAFL